jgi:hypothetical protein
MFELGVDLQQTNESLLYIEMSITLFCIPVGVEGRGKEAA